MPGTLLAEDPDGGLDLGGRRDEVGLEGLTVGIEPAGADGLALADTRVDDHPVEGPQLRAELAEDLEHGVVVGDVQRPGDDRDAGVRGSQVGRQRLEPVGAPRAEGEVAAAGRELAGHALAKARARARDQDVLPQDHPWRLPVGN